MAKKAGQEPADYILPLYINGLEGRMLRLPAPKGKNREVLFVYGQHSSLERWWGLVHEFNRFGAVTMPDLPGFGGMDSLYKSGQKGNIDNLADYLAAFLKLRYKNKKVTIAAMSLGFVIVTRMLQRYPDLTKKVEMLVSVVGFAHKDDFVFSKPRHFVYTYGAWIVSHRIPAWIFQHVFLRPAYLRRVYARSYNAREKFADLSGDEFDRTMDTEIHLWRVNDIRTQMQTSYEMLTLDNTKKRVDLPVIHVAAKKDRYFNNTVVEQHLRQIFKDYEIYYMKGNHAPTIIADAKAAAPFIPAGVRKLLNKKSK